MQIISLVKDMVIKLIMITDIFFSYFLIGLGCGHVKKRRSLLFLTVVFYFIL